MSSCPRTLPAHNTFWYNIPDNIFTALVEDLGVPKGVRSTIVHHNGLILDKIMPDHHHESIARAFGALVSQALGDMGLRFVKSDFWLGGAGHSYGRVCSKEGDTTFFPGPKPGLGEPVP